MSYNVDDSKDGAASLHAVVQRSTVVVSNLALTAHELRLLDLAAAFYTNTKLDETNDPDPDMPNLETPQEVLPVVIVKVPADAMPGKRGMHVKWPGISSTSDAQASMRRAISAAAVAVAAENNLDFDGSFETRLGSKLGPNEFFGR
jgi:hypothetical protein